jgi:excisionase family DNA binding protein
MAHATATATVPELAQLAEDEGPLITYPRAAQLTGVSVRTLKRLSAVGELPCYRSGSARCLRIRANDLARLFERVA